MDPLTFKPEAELKKVWRTVWSIFFCIGLAGICVLILARVPPLIWSLILLGWLFIFLLILAYLPAYFRTLEYTLDDEALKRKSGVFWRQRSTVPFGKITNIDISQGPLERKYGISKLHIQTAGAGGTESPELLFHGIRDSEALKDLIMDRVAGHSLLRQAPQAPPAPRESDKDLLRAILVELSAIRSKLDK